MLEIISEGITGGLLVYDNNDLIVYASPQLETLLPVARDHLAPGTRLRDLLGATYDSGARFVGDPGNGRRILSRESWIADHIAALWKERSETVERRGADRWISFVRRRLSSGYGVCIVKDVSESRKREEQWRVDVERVQLTEDVLDNLPFPVIVKDANLTYVAVNKAACRFHDLPADALLGNTGADVHSANLETRLDTINRRVLDSGEEVQLAERLTRADGSEIVIVANKFRIGKPGRHYLVTAIQDITDLVEFDEQGRGMVNLIQDPELYSAVLRRDGYGAPNVAPVEADLSGGQILLVSHDPAVKTRASRVLTRHGAELSAVHSAEELALCLELAAESAVRIDVVVFDERLYPACAGIVELRGMPIVVLDADADDGLLAVRVAKALAERPQAEMAGDQDWDIVSDDELDGIDVLVAEDNEVNKIVFSQILEGLGYRYVIAADGEEAVALWQQHRPGIVLMDITLPKLTGFEASRKIRQLEDGVAPTPIIGVLPQAFDRDREECFVSGMDDVILKPISPEALEAVFHRFLTVAPARLTQL